MTVRDFLSVLDNNQIVSVSDCGRHGGFIVKDTPVYMAFSDLGEINLEKSVKKVFVLNDCVTVILED